MCDYLSGGKGNFASDCAAVQNLFRLAPANAYVPKANRQFLGAAARFAAEQGITQYIDLGAGLPSQGSTHEVARLVQPTARVVYVDYDPVVLAHARALLTSSEAGATEYIEADLRDTPAILVQARQLLDFTRPVAVTLLAVLHAIPDSDDPHAVVARIMDAVPCGSYLAISHAGSDLLDRQTLDSVQDIVTQMVHLKPGFRSREQVRRFFAGLDLVEPGLVRAEEWHPGPAAGDAGKSTFWCAVGRKP
jgi:O-methyltransferase involved in polyketide biosynthesis